MKKPMTILLFVLMITMMAACGKSGSNIRKKAESTAQAVQTAQPTETTAETETKTEEIEVVTEPPETEPPVEKVNIEWKTITDTVTDNDGYTYEVTYKISPWILLSNSDIINDAWDEVGRDNPLPEFDDWGLKRSNNSYYVSVPKGGLSDNFCCSLNDMYYCVGTVSVRNTTSGWSITSETKRSLYSSLCYSIIVSDNTEWNSINSVGEVFSIGRVYYSNGYRNQSNCVSINPEMKSDNWGPIPFVIMVPENFSPNYPDGQFYDYIKSGVFDISESGFNIYGYMVEKAYNQNKESFDYFNIGIIGKNREYVVANN